MWLCHVSDVGCALLPLPLLLLLSTLLLTLAVASFMKLRLDRVLKVDLSALSEAEVMSAGDELPDFKKPEKWTAPYSMYTPGWWKLFYPGASAN